MARSRATSVADYLAEQTPEMRASLTQVRRVVRKNLPRGYQEGIGFGMITYSVPLEIYPATYNGQPLCYAALAAQKGYASLYLMCAYGSADLRRRIEEGFRKAGKRLDMGKSCIRFKRAEDLDLDSIGEVVSAVPLRKYVALAEAVHTRKRRPPARKAKPEDRARNSRRS